MSDEELKVEEPAVTEAEPELVPEPDADPIPFYAQQGKQPRVGGPSRAGLD